MSATGSMRTVGMWIGRTNVAPVRGESGIALIVVAIFMFVMLAISGLAIDMAYMYFEKNELQVAADAAALAGGAYLDSTGDIVQTEARDAAVRFAEKNNLSEEELEISVGFWNVASSTYLVNTTPVNAIRVKAERREGLFLGKLVGWPFMSASAEAIADQDLGLPVIPLPVCANSIIGAVSNFSDPACPGKKFIISPHAEDCAMAWGQPAACPYGTNCEPTLREFKDYLNAPYGGIDLCGRCIGTSQGQKASIFSALQDSFDDQMIEDIPLAYNEGATPWSNTVDGWRILIPVARPDNILCGYSHNPCPGGQGDPFYVWAMAEVIVSKVDSAPADECPTCDNEEMGITLIGNSPTPTPMETTFRIFNCTGPGQLDTQGVPLDQLIGMPKLVK